MNLKDCLKEKLKEIGADGLYTNDCDEPCGCSIDNIAPCECNPLDCLIAKKDRSGKFHPIED